MSLQARNMLWYGGIGALSLLVAFLSALLLQLPGDDPINWRRVTEGTITSILPLLVALLASMKRPRPGSEHLALDVDRLREAGIPKSRMVVLPDDYAAKQAGQAEEPSPLHRRIRGQ